MARAIHKIDDFKRFFLNLPRTWQDGLLAAMQGDVFIGDLDDKDGARQVAVFFVPHDLGKVIEGVLSEAMLRSKEERQVR